MADRRMHPGAALPPLQSLQWLQLLLICLLLRWGNTTISKPHFKSAHVQASVCASLCRSVSLQK